MRIASLSNPDLVNSNYRSYQPMQALAARPGHDLLLNHDRPLSLQELLHVDVVHVHRIASAEMQRVARACSEAGVGVVWDNDDDVTAVPKTNPLYARHGGKHSHDRRAEVRAMVRLADVVTTPSAILAEQYRELGAADARVLENYLARDLAPPRPEKHDGVVIAWLAALEHQVDYQQLGLRDILLRLLEEHPDLRVMSIGLGLGLPADRYDHIPLVEFLELARTLSRCDIAIAPLVDIPWNRARSNIKLKEYAAAGLPWLASPVGPYLELGEAQGGRLVPDEGWHPALERLIANGRERRKLAKHAAKWAKGQRVEQHVGRWDAVLRDAVERARTRSRHAAAAP